MEYITFMVIGGIVGVVIYRTIQEDREIKRRACRTPEEMWAEGQIEKARQEREERERG